jgi:hypothetical protein
MRAHRPRAATDVLAHVGVIEDKSAIGEAIERRHLDLLVAVTSECIGPLLIGEDVQQVGLLHQLFR